MAKTPEEMTNEQLLDALMKVRHAAVDLAGNYNEPLFVEIYGEILERMSPTPPAPIAAQTEKRCDWVCPAWDGKPCSDCAAEQVDAARLVKLERFVRWVRNYALEKNLSALQIKAEFLMTPFAASSSPLETPANFSFHLAHILDISYFNPSIETHGCMPDETGRCMVTACACRCHFTPAPADTGAEGHIFCGMCGDTGLQNGHKCPQAGCRKANKLPPFSPSTGDTPQPQDAPLTQIDQRTYDPIAFLETLREFHRDSLGEFDCLELDFCIAVLKDQREIAALGKTPDAREGQEK